MRHGSAVALMNTSWLHWVVSPCLLRFDKSNIYSVCDV